jgi:synaptic vesicle membrane protein VAT-1
VKAWIVTKYGGPDVLSLVDWPTPAPGPGMLLVRIRAIGLNFADLFGRMGIYPMTPPAPFVPGLEFAGEIVAMGEGVIDLHPGMRVMGYSRHGSHAEFVAVSAQNVIPVPDGMSEEEAAAFTVTALTAYHGMVTIANVREGEKVLIHAAAGGVGLAMVQLGRHLGAELFATAGTDEKCRLATGHGAQHTINYRASDFAAGVRRITGGGGVDVVQDSVGGRVFRRGWGLLNSMGRYVLFGLADATGPGGLNKFRAAFALGRMGFLLPSPFVQENRTFAGFNLGTVVGKEKILREEAAAITGLYRKGALRSVIGRTFPFAQMVEAHRFLQGRQSVGKVVVRL